MEISLCITFYKKITSSDGSECVFFFKAFIYFPRPLFILSAPQLARLPPAFHPRCGSLCSFLTSKKSQMTKTQSHVCENVSALALQKSFLIRSVGLFEHYLYQKLLTSVFNPSYGILETLTDNNASLSS